MTSVLDWLGRTIGLKDGKFWSAYFGGRNSTGKPISRETVLSVAAAWACARLLSETVGILPYFIYQKLPDGDRRQATDHPLYSILHDRPNPDMSALDFWESVAGCMVMEGNSFALKLKSGNGGRVVGMDLIDPRAVQVYREPSTNLLKYRFNYRSKTYDVAGDDVVHWRGFGIGGDVGLSPIRYGANTFGIAMAGDDAAGSTFRNTSNQSGFIQTPTVLKQEQRDQFNKNLANFQADENAGKFMLLEGGFTYEAMGINPDDLQMLQARGFSVEQVCSFFRVPPFMIGHTEKNTSWGTGLEQTVIAFITFALFPYLKRISKRNDLALLSVADRAAGYYTEFSIEGLLQADSQARAAFYSQMTQNGIYTRDDVRVKENLPKKGGNAGVLTVQSALVPLDMLGKAAAGGDPANNVRNALRAWLDVEDKKDAARAAD